MTGPEATTAADLEEKLALMEGARSSFGGLSPKERAAVLDTIADALDSAGSGLVGLAMAESHLPESRLSSELARATFQVRQLAERARSGEQLVATIEPADDRFALGPRPDLRSVRVPVGCVLVFAASNFPFAFSVLGGDTASALAAGCPVMVKAHPGHPALSAATFEVALGALPTELREVLQIVFGVECGTAALLDHRIRAGAFTGSTEGGRALFDLAASRPDPIPFYGELGSVNPVIVSPGVVRERATALIEGYVNSFSLGVGQFCTNPGLLFVPAGHQILEKMVDVVRAVEAAPMLGDWVAERFDEHLDRLAQRGTVRAVHRGTASGLERSPSLFATSLSTIGDDFDLLNLECFGPSSLVIEYESSTQLLAFAARLAPSLTATVHALNDEHDFVRPLVELMVEKAGRVLMNGWPTGVAVSPAMQHGGPYPSSTASLYSSVGGNAIDRFLRPVSFQNFDDDLLPPALQDANPWGIARVVSGRRTTDSVERRGS